LLRTAVVIPTYNEKDNVETVVSGVLRILPQAHIVIVDDNSPDGTGRIAEGLLKNNSRIHLIRRTGTRGLGLAYIDGFRFALNGLDADYIVQMDADLSHDPECLPLFLRHADKHDLVIGSRFLDGGSLGNRTICRNVVSKLAQRAANMFTDIDLTDVTTGFKCFRRSFLGKVELGRITSKGFAFQLELSYVARAMGADIKEIPIVFGKRLSGSSKMSAEIVLEGIQLVMRLSSQRSGK